MDFSQIIVTVCAQQFIELGNKHSNAVEQSSSRPSQSHIKRAKVWTVATASPTTVCSMKLAFEQLGGRHRV